MPKVLWPIPSLPTCFLCLFFLTTQYSLARFQRFLFLRANYNLHHTDHILPMTMEDISRNYQCPGYIIALDKVSCLQKRRWLASRQSHGNEFINAVRNFGSEIGYRKSPRITINFFVQCIYYTFDGFFVYKDKVLYLYTT